MKIEKTDLFTIIHPDEGYKLSNLDKTEMYEGYVCLGIYDSPDNYTEATIEEYNNWVNETKVENEITIEVTKDDLYDALRQFGVE